VKNLSAMVALFCLNCGGAFCAAQNKPEKPEVFYNVTVKSRRDSRVGARLL